MTTINNVSMSSASVQQAQSAKKVEEVQTEKKGFSKPTMILLGTSALATAAIGGLLYRNSAKLSKEISNLKDSLIRQINFQKNDKDFCNIFNPDLLQGHIDEAAKLSKKEQLAKLKEISGYLGSDRGLSSGLKSSVPEFRLDTAKLPKDVQDAIASKDQLKATKAYCDYCDTLFYPSSTAGANIAESVEKVFGKGNNIKPHTYDISKEADRIATAQYGAGGYNDITVLSDNRIASKLNHKNMVSLYSSSPTLSKTENAIISSGIVDGKPVVTITYRALNRSDSINAIRLMSPNSQLTPAQKDLLKLKDSAASLDISDLGLTTLPKDSSYSQTNFDAILSAIQTLASQVK